MDPRLYGKRGYDIDLTVFRSLFALDPNTNIPISTNLLMTSDGIGGIQWESLAWYTSTVSISNIKILDVNTANAIPVHNLTIQNGNLLVDGAGAIGSGISIIQLASSITGLGSAGYVSTASLYSTVAGLGTAGYVSTAQFNSFSNFIYNPVSYISSGNLFSTSISLLGYIDGFVNSQGSAISSLSSKWRIHYRRCK